MHLTECDDPARRFACLATIYPRLSVFAILFFPIVCFPGWAFPSTTKSEILSGKLRPNSQAKRERELPPVGRSQRPVATAPSSDFLHYNCLFCFPFLLWLPTAARSVLNSERGRVNMAAD